MNAILGNDSVGQAVAGHQYVGGSKEYYSFDRVIALFALVFLLPLLVVTTLCILIFDRGPILYRHCRIGYGGELFYCLKFRTMVVNADHRLQQLLERDPRARLEWQRDHKLRQDPRITWLGYLLRKSSIDELPQLINVFRGEMRIVGPRPIVEGEMHRYGRFFSYYISVVPGITGLWQVSGRNAVSYRRDDSTTM